MIVFLPVGIGTLAEVVRIVCRSCCNMFSVNRVTMYYPNFKINLRFSDGSYFFAVACIVVVGIYRSVSLENTCKQPHDVITTMASAVMW